MKRHKTKLISILVVTLIFSYLLGYPNKVRYHIEKNYGEPHTFFYSVGLGIMFEDNNYYKKEFQLDDIKSINIDPSFINHNVESFLYGRLVNSDDPLVVILNDNVIYNDKISNIERPNIWEQFYIIKNFVVKLNGMRRGSNELIISSGNVSNKYMIKIE